MTSSHETYFDPYRFQLFANGKDLFIRDILNDKVIRASHCDLDNFTYHILSSNRLRLSQTVDLSLDLSAKTLTIEEGDFDFLDEFDREELLKALYSKVDKGKA